MAWTEYFIRSCQHWNSLLKSGFLGTAKRIQDDQSFIASNGKRLFGQGCMEVFFLTFNSVSKPRNSVLLKALIEKIATSNRCLN